MSTPAPRGVGGPRAEPCAVVLDDHVLALHPGLDAALAAAGALVMRAFRGLPNPQLLRRHAGVAVVGGPDRAGLLDRLERATATLAGVAPVVGLLPPGVAACRELLGPGVVDLVPAGAPRAAERILLMARVPVVTARRGEPRTALPLQPARAGDPELQAVAVASSTGGVWVLGELLRQLPREGRAVLVAQHMDGEFVPAFARWLESASGWPTVVVSGAAPLAPGVALVPGAGQDLVLDGPEARSAPAVSRYVPSADRLLGSVAALGARATGVVLSGMGADGAEGLAELARCGGRAICQAPATAVVPSMPERALARVPGALSVDPAELAAAVAQARPSAAATARR
ncbi:MAG: CheB methylesterase domain-containing protein [Anaeromyxobacter sp.]